MCLDRTVIKHLKYIQNENNGELHYNDLPYYLKIELTSKYENKRLKVIDLFFWFMIVELIEI
jgi:hypothetical protein